MSKQILKPNFSTPFYCSECKKIRGLDVDETGLNTSHESLMWNSFQMCSRCYSFKRDFPEQTTKNIELWQKQLEEKEQKIQQQIASRKYRVFFEDVNPKIGNSNFVNTLSNVEFFRYGIEAGGISIIHSKELVNEKTAQRVTKLISNKNIKSWYEEENASS